MHRRFSVVALRGTGVARSETLDRDHKKDRDGERRRIPLSARTHLWPAYAPKSRRRPGQADLLYVVFGHAWLRP